MLVIDEHKLEIDKVITELDLLGYVVIKVDTLQQREEVSNFLDKMYPYHNERPNFITLHY